MDSSQNGYVKGQFVVMGVFWYTGTDAVYEGEAFCFDTDRGTEGDVDGKRQNYIERPSTGNNRAFAGVALQDHAANSGGQMIEVAMPGSRGINIALGIDTVQDTGYLTMQCGGGTGAGRFIKQGYKGRGSAYVRQTVTALFEGGWSGATMSVDATDGKTVTVADSSDYTALDDILVIVGGENDATGVFVPGRYSIASITDDTTIVLSSTCLSTLSTGTLTLTGYVMDGANPKCQADLMDGDESGGIEFISPPNAGVVGLGYMVGGISFICGVGTMDADSDVTFAQETFVGAQKGFYCLGTIGTNDVTLDLATNGIRLDGSTALTEILAIDTAADEVYLEFKGVRWFTKDLAGCTEG